MPEEPREETLEGAVEVPIDGSLDLHAFSPRDVASVVEEYLDVCRERGILAVRIAHGKGIGVQRDRVHHLLERRSDVVSFRLDSETGAGWGATLVQLAPIDPRRSI
ncbi:MAG: Smr/MutS family protein [Gemmatimonadetes bacterium]|nr:Smr/MutS family protein [Gemmatimonadota bacterium]